MAVVIDQAGYGAAAAAPVARDIFTYLAPIRSPRRTFIPRPNATLDHVGAGARAESKLPPRMTTSRAFTQPNSLACGGFACRRGRSLLRPFRRHRPYRLPDIRGLSRTRRRTNVFSLSISATRPSPPREATLWGAARRVPPAPHGGATFRRDLPDVGSDDGPPGGRTGRARRRGGAPEAAHGARNPELAPSIADGLTAPLAPTRPKIGDTRPAPVLPREPEASPQPGNGRASQATPRQKETQRAAERRDRSEPVAAASRGAGPFPKRRGRVRTVHQ